MGLGEAKLSQILSGKRMPECRLLKAAYFKLGIDASFYSPMYKLVRRPGA